MKNTCDTCHYWGKEGSVHGNNRECNNPKLIQGSGGDDSVSMFGYEVESLITGPKFGCLHHSVIPVVFKRDEKEP